MVLSKKNDVQIFTPDLLLTKCAHSPSASKDNPKKKERLQLNRPDEIMYIKSILLTDFLLSCGYTGKCQVSTVSLRQSALLRSDTCGMDRLRRCPSSRCRRKLGSVRGHGGGSDSRGEFIGTSP